jgi:5,10-methylenetetrahydrofolate reductase
MAHIDENPLGPHLPLDPLPGHTSRGRLERVLRRGEFAVTAELNPPDSADPQEVYDRAAIFEGWVDGINAVDASGANCHMSSVGICALLTRMGYAPIMQIACRDKNRIAIQGDVLGAAAMGVSNILCLTGDGVQAGDQPGAKPVFDLDCMSLLETIRMMRDESKFRSGRKITVPPQVFLGAAINPFAPPYDFRPHRLAKKIQAGAQFVQSQYCFDVPMFREYMKRVRDLGLHEKCFILVGVGPLASAKTARWIRSNVPGIRGRAGPEEGRQAALHRHHQRGEGDRGRRRHSRHGLPPGRICFGNRSRIRRPQGAHAVAPHAQAGSSRTGGRASGRKGAQPAPAISPAPGGRLHGGRCPARSMRKARHPCHDQETR